ncbi:DUF1467 family protein [Allorhizobium sp. BGMRC 0089]|uniref:DUF1467 family protein n=1 Tax=Allorhizobium sonneratiae TaxID=2934936 RepID=UPI0020338544|nr:DUF1467 family protein [Allorhizobium sonneratiae]MCM2292183.1 DUF1467 family protein [Allorhizobium sonneratiae]
MPWISYAAIYFVMWWITLFAVLPFGVRTQEEENMVVPGTVSSAPARFSLLKVVIATSLVSAAILAGCEALSFLFGFSFADIPQFMPDLHYN